MDPIKVFIKQEPHKEAKIAEKRFRLILAVSMVDTMIDRILFGWFQNGLATKHYLVPSAIGWTPMRGGYRSLPKGVKLMADKKMWDWTVTWQARAFIDVVKMLRPNGGTEWETLVEARYSALFEHAIYQMPNGALIRQGWPGIMKSGCYLTIAGNSVMQDIMSQIAYDRLGWERGWFKAGGDDTIEDPPPDVEAYLRELNRMGAVVKEWKLSDEQEFLGFVYPRQGCPKPLYEQKHLYSLLHMDPRVQESMLESYLLLYANDDEQYEMLVLLATTLGYPELDRRMAYKRVWLG